MDVIKLERGHGKTTYCLERALRTKYPILTANNNLKKLLMEYSKTFGDKYKDVSIISLEEFNKNKIHYDGIIIDELEGFLKFLLNGCNIDTVTF